MKLLAYIALGQIALTLLQHTIIALSALAFLMIVWAVIHRPHELFYAMELGAALAFVQLHPLVTIGLVAIAALTRRPNDDGAGPSRPLLPPPDQPPPTVKPAARGGKGARLARFRVRRCSGDGVRAGYLCRARLASAAQFRTVHPSDAHLQKRS